MLFPCTAILLASHKKEYSKLPPQALLGLLLLLDLLEVELELLPLKDVPISTADLTGTARDAGKKLPALELLLERRVHLVLALATLVLGNHVLALVLLASNSTLLGELNTVVLEVPLTEGSSINLHNGVADKSVGTHKLVVGGVVHNIEDAGAGGDTLSGPGKVPGLKTESTTLDEAVPAADKVDDLGPDTGHGRLAPDLEFSLLAVSFALATGCTVLVDRVTGDGHCVCETFFYILGVI